MSCARSRSRRGAAAIEFALCLVFVLMPLFAAVMEWSWYFYQETRVMRVARDAARLAVSDTIVDGNRESVALGWANDRLNEMNMDISDDAVAVAIGAETITVGTGTRDLLQIAVNVPFEAVTGLLPDGLSPPDMLVVNYDMAIP